MFSWCWIISVASLKMWGQYCGYLLWLLSCQIWYHVWSVWKVQLLLIFGAPKCLIIFISYNVVSFYIHLNRNLQPLHFSLLPLISIFSALHIRPWFALLCFDPSLVSIPIFSLQWRRLFHKMTKPGGNINGREGGGGGWMVVVVVAVAAWP